MALFPGERELRWRHLGGIKGSREFKQRLLKASQEIKTSIQDQQDDFFTSFNFNLKEGLKGRSNAGLAFETSGFLNQDSITDFAPENNFEAKAKRRSKFHGVFGIELDANPGTSIVKLTRETISISIDVAAAHTPDLIQMDFTPEQQQILAALMFLPKTLLEEVPEEGLIIGTLGKDRNLFDPVLALPKMFLSDKTKNDKTLVIINEADEELKTRVYHQESLSLLSPVRLFFLDPTLSRERSGSLHDGSNSVYLFRLLEES